jgi:hypothetical protein
MKKRDPVDIIKRQTRAEAIEEKVFEFVPLLRHWTRTEVFRKLELGFALERAEALVLRQ